MSDDAHEPDGAFLAPLGIVDRASGTERAHRAWQRLIDAGSHVLGSSDLSYTIPVVLFSGFLARTQGLHEGTVAAIEADNPYAAFTLLRSYAETAAALLYLKDHPAAQDRFWRRDGVRGVPIGKITAYAETRFAGFKPIYRQLSEYTHPESLSLLASHQIENEVQRIVRWSSSPAFKSDHDMMVACGWAVELAEATSHLLVEYGATWPQPDARK